MAGYPSCSAGSTASAYAIPISYPASCSPQAWASAAPFWLLRTSLLRLEPSVPDGTLTCDPLVPAGFGTLRVENLPLGGARLSIAATGTTVEVGGLPESLKVSAPDP